MHFVKFIPMGSGPPPPAFTPNDQVSIFDELLPCLSRFPAIGRQFLYIRGRERWAGPEVYQSSVIDPDECRIVCPGQGNIPILNDRLADRDLKGEAGFGKFGI